MSKYKFHTIDCAEQLMATAPSGRTRRSVVFVTHNLGEALSLRDRVVMLATGGQEVVNLRVPFQHSRDVLELPFTKEFRELEHDLSQKLV